MPPSNGRQLRNADQTDRELLIVIHDVAALDPDGWATSTELAIQLGFTVNGKKSGTLAQKVSTRLAWMKRYGFIEKLDPKDRARLERDATDSCWRLTQVGRELMAGQLTKSVQTAIERMAPGQQLLMMRSLSRRYVDESAPVAAAVRREWEHHRVHRLK